MTCTPPWGQGEIFGFLTKKWKLFQVCLCPKCCLASLPPQKTKLQLKDSFGWMVSWHQVLLSHSQPRLHSRSPITGGVLLAWGGVSSLKCHYCRLCSSKKLCAVIETTVLPLKIQLSLSVIHLLFSKFLTSNIFSVWVCLHVCLISCLLNIYLISNTPCLFKYLLIQHIYFSYLSVVILTLANYLVYICSNIWQFP
jgi:hypothetical protein